MPHSPARTASTLAELGTQVMSDLEAFPPY